MNWATCHTEIEALLDWLADDIITSSAEAPRLFAVRGCLVEALAMLTVVPKAEIEEHLAEHRAQQVADPVNRGHDGR